MANEYLVNSDDMTSVADAIRNKGGTSDALTFPSGFVDAVGAIQVGGGSEDLLAKMLNDQMTEYASNEVTTLRQYAFFQRNNLVSVSFPNFAGEIPSNCFLSCGKLATVNMPNTRTIAASAFQYCPSIERIRFPKVVYLNSNVFYTETYNANKLKVVDLGASNVTPQYIAAQAFARQTKIEAIVLRYSSVIKLSDVNAFLLTPLTGDATQYGGVYSGHIYVPQALIAEYQAATNWSSLYAAYPDIFQPIEGSVYEE